MASKERKTAPSKKPNRTATIVIDVMEGSPDELSFYVPAGLVWKGLNEGQIRSKVFELLSALRGGEVKPS